MNVAIYSLTMLMILSAASVSQVVECSIKPIKASFDCYESIIVKVQLRNMYFDTVCVDNIAHEFSGRPMKIFIDGKEVPYGGPRGHVFSGVYLSPYSEYCFYMKVENSHSEAMGITRTRPGMYELQYYSKIFRVKNRSITREIVGSIAGSLGYEVFCSRLSSSIAGILREKLMDGRRHADMQERYQVICELIDMHGIDTVDRVVEYMIRTSDRREGIWSDKVHVKSSRLKKKVNLSVPGECVSRWDE